MTPGPTEQPVGPGIDAGSDAGVGAELAVTARILARSFESGLAAAGGSRSTWLILRALDSGPAANQRELAAAVGIQDATLTHHLSGMEADGLVTRRRDPGNRRVQVVELTAAGAETVRRLREHVAAHDRRLRAGFGPAELALLRRFLGRLRENVEGGAGIDRAGNRTPIGTDRYRV